MIFHGAALSLRLPCIEMKSSAGASATMDAASRHHQDDLFHAHRHIGGFYIDFRAGYYHGSTFDEMS